MLLQLAGLTEKLADLDQRQATADPGGLTSASLRWPGLVDDAQGHHGQPCRGAGRPRWPGPAGRRAGHRRRDARRATAAGYQPPAAPKFWKLDGPAHDEAIGKLRAWVEDVYRPGYGHLAASLGDCWDQHPLCLYILDWLTELWSVLYLAPARTPGTLAGQAEWHTRLLPAAAEQLARETRGCAHASTRRPPPPGTGARP